MSIANKVLIIGWDSACWSLLDPWLEAGELPNLKNMIDSGSHGVLNSVIHPMSAQAWTSMMTGQNPGKHGVVDFLLPEKDSYDFYWARGWSRKSPSLWGRLSGEGEPVITVNVPLTYPAEEVNGIIVSGMDAPWMDEHAVYPSSFIDELKNIVPDYEIDPPVHQAVCEGNLEKALNMMVDSVRQRLQLAEHLLKTRPWTLATIVFTATDKVQHYFWRFMDEAHPQYDALESVYFKDAILNVYREADKALGRLRHIAGDIPVFLISDHGGKPVTDKVFSINQWLAENNLLTFRDESINRKLFRSFRRRDNNGEKEDYGMVSKPGKELFSRLLKEKTKTSVVLENIDWERTQAYSEEARGTIRINLKGRMPNGTVYPGAEYENLCRRICVLLKDIVDPETGGSVISEVYRREELYSGPYMEEAGDILFTLNEETGYHLRSGKPKSACSMRRMSDAERADHTRPNGEHSLEGIYVASGSAIIKNKERFCSDIIDIAPTVLYLLGRKIPDSMDGKVMEQLFDQGMIGNHPVEFRRDEAGCPGTVMANASAAGDIVIGQRLRGLGYFG